LDNPFPVRCKDLGDVSYRSRVIVVFVSTISIGLSLNIFTVPHLSQTERQTDGIGLAKSGTKHQTASGGKNWQCYQL